MASTMKHQVFVLIHFLLKLFEIKHLGITLIVHLLCNPPSQTKAIKHLKYNKTRNFDEIKHLFVRQECQNGKN